MNGASIGIRDDVTVKARLIRAADQEVTEHGVNGILMEAVAKRAGVSRATAFRQLGNVAEAVVLVALLRADRHIEAVNRLMAKKTRVFAKIEAALIYTARELPTDPTIVALMSQRSGSVQDPRVHAHAMGVLVPVLEEGRRLGEIRTDIGMDELVDFVVEQTYLAAEQEDRSEENVRRRFRNFMIPALEVRGVGGELVSRTQEVVDAVGAAQEALANLANAMDRTDGLTV